MILIIQAVLYPASASLNRREINKNVCWENFQLPGPAGAVPTLHEREKRENVNWNKL